MNIDQRSPRVFITQERETFNYNTASEFGELTPVTSRDVSNVPNSLHNEDLYEAIDDAMAEFDPNTDYLLPSGSPLVTGLCFASLASAGHSTIKVLRYDGRNYVYVPLTLRLRGGNR